MLEGRAIRVDYSASQAKGAIQYEAELLDTAIQSITGRKIPFIYNPNLNPVWSWPVPPQGSIEAYRMVGKIVKAIRVIEEEQGVMPKQF